MWSGASTPGKPANYWSLFGLFAVLASGFGIAAYMPETFGVDIEDGGPKGTAIVDRKQP